MGKFLFIALLLLQSLPANADDLPNGVSGIATIINATTIAVKDGDKTYQVKLNGLRQVECNRCTLPSVGEFDVDLATTRALHRAINGLPKSENGKVICTILDKSETTLDGVCYGQYGDLTERVISEGWGLVDVNDTRNPTYREIHLYRIQEIAKSYGRGIWASQSK